jgi:broad specificity phosphatase PhoE
MAHGWSALALQQDWLDGEISPLGERQAAALRE